ncbi:MAG: rRNA pseudouridine synthase [Firmicutes bacterium]|nr:rRNA pseudouridine synthase [Bacillota bacterium]
MERLQKYIARCGVASRRKAEEMITQGKVRVNGKIVTILGTTIDEDNDSVQVEGKNIRPPHSFTYYALYKPKGYITSKEDAHAEKIVTSLLPPKPSVVPVGRLDKDSEGLLLLTNDGELTQTLTHPSYAHEKEYLVRIKTDAKLTVNDVEEIRKKMCKGYMMDGSLARVKDITSAKFEGGKLTLKMILTQGKKRQIRRMCDMAGLEVIQLIRVRMGKLTLGNLKPGEYRRVKRGDII